MRVVALQGNTVCDFHSGVPEALPPIPSAVTVGSFDGLHVGHRKIIATMIDQARQGGLRSVVVTFEPHPRKVLDGSSVCPVRLLTTFDEKISQFMTMEIDILFVVRFDREFASRSSESFIRDVLVQTLGAKHVIVGYDHGFGSKRSGSESTLHALGAECGFAVDVVGEVVVGNETVSSTRIRELLVSGRIKEANVCLGAPYMISGTVVDGRRLGRQIGFPTANLSLSEPCKLLPANGVYVARAELDGRHYPVMMNIGRRPTVSYGGEVTVEAHIIGYSGELYGRFLMLHLLDFIREEKRFDSLDGLRAQLEQDKLRANFYQE
ncbi:MAG: bifunctional riboflavin kinase/FAD synthetase [Chlorobiaceae bacterium]|nr:bifunctional riboflavin kinase/FAD synthetase [Chlorobiaceae bacterium]